MVPGFQIVGDGSGIKPIYLVKPMHSFEIGLKHSRIENGPFLPNLIKRPGFSLKLVQYLSGGDRLVAGDIDRVDPVRVSLFKIVYRRGDSWSRNQQQRE